MEQIYILTGELKTIFIKGKLLMRSCETDKSISVRNTIIEDDIKKLLNIIEYKGIIDVDILEKEGKYYISEVNPRFGGGYPHGYEMGINVPKMIINNLNGKVTDEHFEY